MFQSPSFTQPGYDPIYSSDVSYSQTYSYPEFPSMQQPQGYQAGYQSGYDEFNTSYSAQPQGGYGYTHVAPTPSALNLSPHHQQYVGWNGTYASGPPVQPLTQRHIRQSNKVPRPQHPVTGGRMHTQIPPRRPGYNSDGPPKIVVGPVIGLVTADSARVMVEVNVDTNLTASCTGPMGTAANDSVYAHAGRPVVFRLHGLQPQTRYEFQVHGFAQVRSSFHTLPPYPTLGHKLAFAVTACNKVRTTHENRGHPGGDVWAYFAKAARNGEYDIALHLGDQIYGDDDYEAMQQGKVDRATALSHCKFAQAKELLDKLPRSEWPQAREAICEMYRDQYRETWGHPATQVGLANCSNIMMYDDHEIRDDLGDKPEELDPNSSVRLIAECARVTCFEYQRQLQEDFDLSNPVSVPRVARENHIIHKFGEYGLMMVDSRGAKVFNRQEGDPLPFLTTEQWNDIHNVLAPGGFFEDVKLLLFMTQIPIVFFDKEWTERIAKKADDFEGMWSYGRNEIEQVRMLDALFDWKQRGQGRQVVMGGGDVHLGGYTDIFQNGRYGFKQIIVGPISNSTIGGVSMIGTNFIKSLEGLIPHNWSFKHYKWTNKRNYGVIRTHPGPGPYYHVSHCLLEGLDNVVETQAPAKGDSSCSIM